MRIQGITEEFLYNSMSVIGDAQNFVKGIKSRFHLSLEKFIVLPKHIVNSIPSTIYISALMFKSCISDCR